MCRLRQHYELGTDADAVPVHDVQSQIRAEFGRELSDKVSLISKKAFLTCARKRRLGRWCYTGLKIRGLAARQTLLETAGSTDSAQETA